MSASSVVRRPSLRWSAGLTIVLACSGCGSAATTAAKPAEKFTIEKTEGSDVVRIHLEPGVAERLVLRTQPVANLAGAGASVGTRALPYGALLYKPDGMTFVYTNPEPDTFVHETVTVDRVNGDVAVISAGPAQGTPVVTDGAAELMGMEFGVGK